MREERRTCPLVQGPGVKPAADKQVAQALRARRVCSRANSVRHEPAVAGGRATRRGQGAGADEPGSRRLLRPQRRAICWSGDRHARVLCVWSTKKGQAHSVALA